MSRRTLIPTRLARAVVAVVAHACLRDPDLYHPALDEAVHAAGHRRWVRDEAAGRTIVAAWPPGAYPHIDTGAWHAGEFVDLAAGIDPEQIEGDRRFLTDWPYLHLDDAAAEAARLIPHPNPAAGPHRAHEVAVARVLLAVLLHAAHHAFHDTDQVRAWAGDLTPESLHAVHTSLHDSGGDTWPPPRGARRRSVPAQPHPHPDQRPGHHRPDPRRRDHQRPTAMTTPNTGTPKPLTCLDCGAPATVEALRVGPGNQLLSDVTACPDHAGPYLADATDVVHLHPSALPTHATGPVPALDDRVQIDGRTWEVWDVQPGPAGGHEVVLFAETPDADPEISGHGFRGDLTTVVWQPTNPPPATQTGPGPAGPAGPPTVDPTRRADPAAIPTRALTPAEQDAADTAHAHPDDHGWAGPVPRETPALARDLPQCGLDELAADHGHDADGLDLAADHGL